MSKPETTDIQTVESFKDSYDTAIGEMLDYYATNDLQEWVWPHIEFCARRGIVYMTPDVVLLARPVDIRIDIDVLNAMGDTTARCDVSLHDHTGWHILYASGELQDFFPLCPYELPWLIWQRKGGKARVQRFDRVKKKIMNPNNL